MVKNVYESKSKLDPMAHFCCWGPNFTALRSVIRVGNNFGLVEGGFEQSLTGPRFLF